MPLQLIARGAEHHIPGGTGREKKGRRLRNKRAGAKGGHHGGGKLHHNRSANGREGVKQQKRQDAGSICVEARRSYSSLDRQKKKKKTKKKCVGGIPGGKSEHPH